jgi:hypothetical protein
MGQSLTLFASNSLYLTGKTGDSIIGDKNRGVGVFMDGSGAVINMNSSSELECDYGYQQDNGTLNCIGQNSSWYIDVSPQNGSVLLNGGTVKVGTNAADYGWLRLQTNSTTGIGSVRWKGGTIFIGSKDNSASDQSQIVTDNSFTLVNAVNNQLTMTTAYSGSAAINVISAGSVKDDWNGAVAPAGFGGSVTGDGAFYTITKE